MEVPSVVATWALVMEVSSSNCFRVSSALRRVDVAVDRRLGSSSLCQCSLSEAIAFAPFCGETPARRAS